MHRAAEMQLPVQIMVYTRDGDNGKTIMVDVMDDHTIEAVKGRIQAMEGFERSIQSLNLGGRELKDECTIRYYNLLISEKAQLKPKEHIHMYMRIPPDFEAADLGPKLEVKEQLGRPGTSSDNSVHKLTIPTGTFAGKRMNFLATEAGRQQHGMDQPAIEDLLEPG